MAEIKRLYLDTNIFILMIESSNRIAQLLYELVSLQMPETPVFLCTSEFTLAELVVLPYRQKDEALLQTYDNMLTNGGAFEVAPIDRRVLWGAAIIRAQYPSLKLPDAIHLATAACLGCTHVLTSDKRLPSSLEIWSRQWGREVGPYSLNLIHIDPDRQDSSILTEIIIGRSAI